MADKNYEVTPEKGSEKKKNAKKVRIMEKKLQEIGTHLSIILELAVAVLVFAASIVSIIHLFPELYVFIAQKGASVAFIDFLEEVFGTGTAAVISPVGELRYKDYIVVINDMKTGELTQKLYDTLTGIQWGKLEDKYNWTCGLE